MIDRRNRIKIIDFGYAGWIVNGMNFKEAFGSIGYSAPEVMRGKYYNPIKADI